MKKGILASIILLIVNGCASMPKDIQPVTNFELPRYLGKWYEIARLDHWFERGMNDVSAEYSMRPDGGVRVLNSGVSEKGAKTAEGRAYFVGDPTVGQLKVAFFGPFYGAYVIFDQQNYQTAYVAGPNKSYLWLLARTPTLPQTEIDRFIQKARALGFDTDALIYPTHSSISSVE